MDDNPTKEQVRAVGDERFLSDWAGRISPLFAGFGDAEARAFAEIENFLASPILGITLGPDLEGKIIEQEALALVNASRVCLLAGVQAMRSPKQQGGPDVE